MKRRLNQAEWRPTPPHVLARSLQGSADGILKPKKAKAKGKAKAKARRAK